MFPRRRTVTEILIYILNPYKENIHRTLRSNDVLFYLTNYKKINYKMILCSVLVSSINT